MTTPTLIITPRRPALLAGHDNELDVLVRVQAPDAPAELPQRAPLHLALVIDRSGSMSGQPLDEAKRCAEFVMDGLQPTDRLSVVAYDNEVRTLVPTTPLHDKESVRRAIRAIDSGGSTDLHGGWFRGAETLAPHATDGTTSRVILLSDGCANHGLVEPDQIYAQCADFARAGVSTSTYGLGDGFNEELMIGMARHGQGSSYYGRTAEDLMDPFREEFELLNALCAKRLRLSVEPAPGVKAKVLNDYVLTDNEGWALPDLAFGGEAWAVVRLRVPSPTPPSAPSPSPAKAGEGWGEGLLLSLFFLRSLHHPRRRAPRDPADVARAAGAPRVGIRGHRRGRTGRAPRRRTRGRAPAAESSCGGASARLERRGRGAQEGRAHRREQSVGGGIAERVA